MTFLITRPEDDDTTLYLSEYSKPIIELAEDRGIDVFDCFHERASKQRVTSLITEKNPKLIMFNGHGSPEIISGYKFEPIIRLEENADLIKDTIVYARACHTAKELGKWCGENGNGVYLGYDDKFRFWTSSSYSHTPQNDPYAKPILDASNHAAMCLLKGGTAGDALRRSKEAFDSVIERLERSNSPQNLRFLLSALYWNREHLIGYGDEKLKM
ncbi:MAG: hypothetical protein V1676_05375 [Candidatus Diapherotrites archaeon]